MRFVRSLALVSAIIASLGANCDDEEPPTGPDLASYTGLYTLTATRLSIDGGCPAAISSPRTVAVGRNASDQLTLPLLIGTGVMADDLNAEGDWSGEGEATLSNGIRVRQLLNLQWERIGSGRPSAEGTLTIEHVAPDGRILCTEVYAVTLVFASV